MAQVDFFANRQDQRKIIEFLFDQTDVRVFELYSEFGQDLREFKSFAELDAACSIGTDEHGNGYAALLSLFSPSVAAKPDIRCVKLDSKRCDGHTFRYHISGWDSIRLDLGGLHKRVVTKSHFGHWSERGARSRGYRSGVDWPALRKLSNRISYHISKRLAVAKAPGRPVLAGAYALYTDGYELKEAAGANFAYADDLAPLPFL